MNTPPEGAIDHRGSIATTVRSNSPTAGRWPVRGPQEVVVTEQVVVTNKETPCRLSTPPSSSSAQEGPRARSAARTSPRARGCSTGRPSRATDPVRRWATSFRPEARARASCPREYCTASIQRLADRIHAVKQTLGECVVVLCGVYCMVETADILAGPPQSVILPNLAESSAPPPMPRRYSRGPSSAASGCSSSPTSSWGATPRRRWAFRSNTCRYRTRASRWAATATSRWRMPASSSATARLVAREPGVFSGGRSSPLP